MSKKENQPAVSVIVPIYNVEAYLHSCLSSLAEQTLRKIEVIMVNDGSTDKSPEIAADFENKYSHFRLIYRKNGGLSRARNMGIEYARGEYIGFVDSDDFVDHTMYETLYKTAVNRKADIVKSGVLLFNDITGRIQDLRQTGEPIITHNSPEKALTAFLKKKMNIVVVNGIYSREIFDDLTFVAGVKYEDHYFTPNALLRCRKFVQINDIHYYYRKRKGSITGQTDSMGKADKVKALNELYRVLKLTGSLEKYADSYSKYFLKMATDYHDSVIHSAPQMLRKGHFDLATLIEPEIIYFINSRGKFLESSRADFNLICRSHFMYFLRKKLRQLYKFGMGGKKGSNKTKSRSSNQQNGENHFYIEYIDRYG